MMTLAGGIFDIISFHSKRALKSLYSNLLACNPLHHPILIQFTDHHPLTQRHVPID